MRELRIDLMQGSELSSDARRAMIELCSEAFAEDYDRLYRDFRDPVHAMGYLGRELISHALWITRWLEVGEVLQLHTAYVEGVATRPHHRRRGFASAIMRRLIGEVQDYDLAALSPADVPFYAQLGWQLWQGPLYARTRTGLLATQEDAVMVHQLRHTPPLDLMQPLSVEWRPGEIW